MAECCALVRRQRRPNMNGGGDIALQGLYEVRYVGDELGYDATMKVLKALNQFKKV